MSHQRAAWREVFMSYPCPTCGAEPRQPCVTKSGHDARTNLHAARAQQGNRCPRCGERITFDADPGTYCARCALLRSLSIERATKHRRVT